MNFDTIITKLGAEILPSAIQLVWLLLALSGLITIGFAILNLYNIAMDGQQPNGPTGGGAVVRMLLGAMMVVPSVTLWSLASALLNSGTQTNVDLLSYINGTAGSTSCANFARAIHLGFVLTGAIGIYRSFRLADDAAKGFQRDGYRPALTFLIGGIGCIFINDLMLVVGNQLGVSIGFEPICLAVFP